MPLANSVQSEWLRDIDAFARQHDLDLNMHLGFEGFADYPIDRGAHPTFAGFMPPRDGFWLSVTLCGQPFAIYAGMPMDMVGTLTEHLEIDGLYPGDDRWEVIDPKARAHCDTVKGRCLFGGGMVVDAAQRGTVESRLMISLLPIVGRVLGRALYDSEHFIFLMKAGRNLVSRMDAEHVFPEAVRWTRCGVPLDPLRALGHSSWGYSQKRLPVILANGTP